MYRIDDLEFEEQTERSRDNENTLNLELKGFNGPLDLLVTLAQTKKLDITRISILSLVDQYLEFIKIIKKKNLSLASDYLVMAAVLAYIKSKLLIPTDGDDKQQKEELPAILEFNLKRLVAMRNSYNKLFSRDLLGNKRFLKGHFTDKEIEMQTEYYCNKNSLIICFANIFNRKGEKKINVKVDNYYTTEFTISRIRELYNYFKDWVSVQTCITKFNNGPDKRKKVKFALISILSASLELAKSGEIIIKQEKEFSEIFFKRNMKL